MAEAGYVLTIVAGNTNTIFGVFAGDRYLSKWRIETRGGRAADEYGAWLLPIFEYVGINPQFISGAIIACVVPSVERVLMSLCNRFFNVEPLVVAPGIKTGLNIQYGRAGDLGPDRLANIAALMQQFPKQAGVVIDYGTTTSFDVVDEKGAYRGGVVVPGVMLNLSAIAGAAPQMPEVPLNRTERVIGTNIVQSIQAGNYWGTVEMTQGLLRRMWRELGVQNTPVVATGGFANNLQQDIPEITAVDTNLTLMGLKWIYDRNHAA